MFSAVYSEFKIFTTRINYEFSKRQFFHNKLIIACRDVFVCRFTCYKLFETMIGLIKNIQSFILTFNKIHQIEIFFINRRFHEGKRPHNYNQNTFQFRYQSRPQSRYNRYNQIKKTCFVCKKKGCWSTNHSQKERDAQRDRIKNSFRKKYNNNKIKRHTRAYIADYESMDFALKTEPDESNIEKEIEILMIDFDSSEILESENAEEISVSSIFLIDYEVINESKIIVIDLINQFFNHRFDLHSQSKTVLFIKKKH